MLFKSRQLSLSLSLSLSIRFETVPPPQLPARACKLRTSESNETYPRQRLRVQCIWLRQRNCNHEWFVEMSKKYTWSKNSHVPTQIRQPGRRSRTGRWMEPTRRRLWGMRTKIRACINKCKSVDLNEKIMKRGPLTDSLRLLTEWTQKKQDSTHFPKTPGQQEVWVRISIEENCWEIVVLLVWYAVSLPIPPYPPYPRLYPPRCSCNFESNSG
jgi:hypothetical protein